MSCGFHRSGECDGDGVGAVTAADASIVVDNTDPANPTITVGSVPAANVKHRFLSPSYRTTNKPASSTTSLVSSDLSIVFARAGRIVAWTYYGSVAAAGSAALIEISVNGGGAWATLGSVLVGEVAFAKTLGAPIAVAAGAEVRVRCVTDGSWTSTTADPQVWLEFEET